MKKVFCLIFFFFFFSSAYSSEPAFKQAYNAFLRQDYLNAQKNLESSPLPKSHPLYDYSLWILGKSALENKNYDASILPLQKIIDSYASSLFYPSAKVALAKVYFEKKDYLKTKEFLDRELNSFEGDLKGEALYYLAISEIELNKASEGRTHLQEAYEKYPNSTTDSYTIIKLKELESNQNKNFFSSSSQTALNRADRFYETKKFIKALEIYDTLLASSDLSIKNQARLKKGKSLYLLKRYSEAISYLQISKESTLSLELKRDSTFALANAYQKIGNLTEAFINFEKVKNDFPQTVEAEESFFKIGKIRFDQGDFQEATKVFEQLSQAYPHGKFRDQALWLIGWNAYHRADWNNALKFLSLLEQGATDSPTQGKALYWEAKIFEKQGNPQKAAETFQKTSQVSPFSYYGFMALKQLKKSKDLSETPAIPKEWVVLKIPPSIEKNKKASSGNRYQKIIALYSLGFGKQSLLEFDRAIKESEGDFNSLLEFMNSSRSSDAYYIPVLIGQKQWDVFKKAFANPTIAEQYRTYLQYPFAFRPLIQKAAKEFSLSPHFIVALMRQESAFQPWIVSSANAQGLTQLLPSTAQSRARKIGVQITNLFDPELNIRIGSAELAAQLQRFSGNWVAVMIAYNAGPGRASEWLSQNGNLPIDEFIEEIPFAETNLYAKLVLRNYWIYKSLYP